MSMLYRLRADPYGKAWKGLRCFEIKEENAYVTSFLSRYTEMRKRAFSGKNIV